ncbi:CaiB/BaiF CoA-transferase family protein [Hydrogenophaga sp.]|uniref:CaiB/BaiF CoA transferase family protein n=1 Tax=Hydrogenophaga sp. TaxID=1904254 RepID=UPI0027208638|nr:CoA transferase [Hydrogenophaga sp.]MDO9436403.1 CoA transferase [Hydrogenophaga sp.]
MNATPLAMEGLRVLDLTQGIAGPYATMLMAAHGAEVIKVEPPGGDWIRNARNQTRGHAPAAIAVNVGKKSIQLDLKNPDQLAIAQRIAGTCDVVVESYRPGVVERLGLGAEQLRQDKPALVYCSVTGFGGDSQLRDRPVIDHIAQAYSGWMHVNADENGVPQRTRNVVLADQITGLYAYQAIASALLRRFRFGTGEQLEVTLAGSMAAFLAPRIVSCALNDGKVGNAEFTAPTGDYPTRQGVLVVAVQKPADVERLFALLDRAEVLQDARFSTPAARLQNAAGLRHELASVLLGDTAERWEQRLAPQGAMVCEARDIAHFLASQSSDGLGLIETLDLPGVGPCPLVRIPGAAAWQRRRTPTRFPPVGADLQHILDDLEALAPGTSMAMHPTPS